MAHRDRAPLRQSQLPAQTVCGPGKDDEAWRLHHLLADCLARRPSVRALSRPGRTRVGPKRVPSAALTLSQPAVPGRARREEPMRALPLPSASGWDRVADGRWTEREWGPARGRDRTRRPPVLELPVLGPPEQPLGTGRRTPWRLRSTRPKAVSSSWARDAGLGRTAVRRPGQPTPIRWPDRPSLRRRRHRDGFSSRAPRWTTALPAPPPVQQCTIAPRGHYWTRGGADVN